MQLLIANLLKSTCLKKFILYCIWSRQAALSGLDIAALAAVKYIQLRGCNTKISSLSYALHAKLYASHSEL